MRTTKDIIVRLLTNLETEDEKLLQILLVGQPELDDKLDSVNLRQLKQRIALRSHLLPLDSNETKGYILRRLQLAGCTYPSALFPPETIAAVRLKPAPSLPPADARRRCWP